jgi:hypothetical protein
MQGFGRCRSNPAMTRACLGQRPHARVASGHADEALGFSRAADQQGLREARRGGGGADRRPRAVVRAVFNPRRTNVSTQEQRE